MAGGKAFPKMVGANGWVHGLPQKGENQWPGARPSPIGWEPMAGCKAFPKMVWANGWVQGLPQATVCQVCLHVSLPLKRV